MKTCMFSTMYLGNELIEGTGRVERHVKYINYYRPLKNVLGFDKFIFSDNGSHPEFMKMFLDAVGSDDIHIINNDNIKRGVNGHLDYLMCWRGVYDISVPIDMGYKKILIIDTDFFILSKKLATHFKDMDSGWNSLWCPRHNFPESACHVLCEDSFPILNKFCTEPMEFYNMKTMECTLPFTNVDKSWNADRYGELGLLQTKEMDAYGQAENSTVVVFEEI